LSIFFADKKVYRTFVSDQIIILIQNRNMKKLFFASLSLVLLQFSSFATDKPHKALVQAKVYKQELSLNEKQTKQVIDLLSKEIDDLRQLQSLRSSSREEYKEKTKDTRLAFEMKLSSILNKQQLEYYKTHREEIKGKIREARLFW